MFFGRMIRIRLAVVVSRVGGFGPPLVVELLLESLDFLSKRLLIGDQMLDKIEQILDCLLGLRIEIDQRRQLSFDPIQNIPYVSSAHTQLYAPHKEKAR